MSEINYTHEAGSLLPNTMMTRHNFLDANNAIAEQINHVKELQAQGKYAEAANYITSQNLQQYVLSAEYINFIDEETRNLEIMTKGKQQSIYYTENEPGFAAAGDVWISSNNISEG